VKFKVVKERTRCEGRNILSLKLLATDFRY